MVPPTPIDVAFRHLYEASNALMQYGVENRGVLHPDDLTEMARIVETIVQQVQPRLVELKLRMRRREN
jgi:hypothetical protein